MIYHPRWRQTVKLVLSNLRWPFEIQVLVVWSTPQHQTEPKIIYKQIIWKLTSRFTAIYNKAEQKSTNPSSTRCNILTHIISIACHFQKNLQVPFCLSMLYTVYSTICYSFTLILFQFLWMILDGRRWLFTKLNWYYGVAKILDRKNEQDWNFSEVVWHGKG